MSDPGLREGVRTLAAAIEKCADAADILGAKGAVQYLRGAILALHREIPEGASASPEADPRYDTWGYRC